MAVATVTVAGCTGAGVNWDQFPSNLQRNIDRAAAAGDCVELQDMFDVWINANQPGGRSTTEVASYINDQMDAAGCFN